MKFQVNGELEIPDVIASLFLGTEVTTPFMNDKGFTISLDNEGLERLGLILGLLYPNYDNLYSDKSSVPSMAHPQSKAQLERKQIIVEDTKFIPLPPESELPQLINRDVAVSTEKKKMSLSELKSKSRKFIG